MLRQLVQANEWVELLRVDLQFHLLEIQVLVQIELVRLVRFVPKAGDLRPIVVHDYVALGRPLIALVLVLENGLVLHLALRQLATELSFRCIVLNGLLYGVDRRTQPVNHLRLRLLASDLRQSSERLLRH